MSFLYACIIAPSAPVMVLITPSSTGTPTAGSSYTLTCVALKSVSGLTQSAQTQWMSPDGTAVTTSGNIVLTSAVSETLRTVQNVTISALSTSDAGVYTCAATLPSPALTTPYQTMQSYTVTVRGNEFKPGVLFPSELKQSRHCAFLTMKVHVRRARLSIEAA